MIVKAKRTFIDKVTKKVHKKGETFKVSKDRYDEILKTGDFVEEVVEEEASSKGKGCRKKG